MSKCILIQTHKLAPIFSLNPGIFVAFKAFKACNYIHKNLFQTKRKMKNRSLKTCNEIPLFSFPQMTLLPADNSDAIRTWQLNCNFILHRMTKNTPAHCKDGSLTNKICLGLNLGVCNLIQFIFKPKLFWLIVWWSSEQNVCGAAKYSILKIVFDGICFF